MTTKPTMALAELTEKGAVGSQKEWTPGFSKHSSPRVPATGDVLSVLL